VMVATPASTVKPKVRGVGSSMARGVPHEPRRYGSAATAWISTLARGSTSAATPTSAIAG
jgi:hypothetical protein